MSAESASPAAPARVLGFDYGARRIGVAFGQTYTGTSQAIAVVPNGSAGPDWTRVSALVREWAPDLLVVGRPLTLEGGLQPITRAADAFARALAERFPAPVRTQDERHSSQEASRRFAAARAAGTRRRGDAELLDAVAAQVIVEDFLQSHARAAAD